MASHRVLWDQFKRLFPSYSDETKEFYQCGRNGIRVVMNSGLELIFTKKNDRNWSLETLDSFIDNFERNHK